MREPFFHLAQINLLLTRAPLDDPLMHGFASRLTEINELAERSPGFVWRFKDNPSSEAATPSPYDNERILINYSVWESPAALKDYVYQSAHAELIRTRHEWGEPLGKASLAMWWTPAGSIPALEEAVERLDYLQQNGSGPLAFDFRGLRPPPAAPNVTRPSEGSALSYDGRVFRVVENSRGGEVGGETTFRYRQKGRRVWASYSGGGLRFGTLIATADREGNLDAAYEHLGPAGFRAGVCTSTPEVLADGRLQLVERWRWTAGGDGSGVSIAEEV